ncbi:Uncharacterised protein [Serratia marcescens]|nr:Uncharacterised protein [Serratia marcescens]
MHGGVQIFRKYPERLIGGSYHLPLLMYST